MTTTLLLRASGLDLVSAFSAAVACINNAGPATNHASPDDFQTWTLAPTMLLGRLELITVFVLFTRAFWRG